MQIILQYRAFSLRVGEIRVASFHEICKRRQNFLFSLFLPFFTFMLRCSIGLFPLLLALVICLVSVNKSNPLKSETPALYFPKPYVKCRVNKSSFEIKIELTSYVDPWYNRIKTKYGHFPFSLISYIIGKS